jgi:hypothetical protein
MTQPPTPGVQYQPQPPAGGGNGLAIASLILGILACVTFCFPPLAGVLGVVAIILGIIAIQKPTGGGMGKAGMVLGIIGIGLGIALYAAAKAGVGWLGKKAQEAEKRIEEEQKKQQEQMQRQNQTSQPGVILFHPSGWMLVLD